MLHVCDCTLCGIQFYDHGSDGAWCGQCRRMDSDFDEFAAACPKAAKKWLKKKRKALKCHDKS
jgi:hypothetical protein